MTSCRPRGLGTTLCKPGPSSFHSARIHGPRFGCRSPLRFRDTALRETRRPKLRPRRVVAKAAKPPFEPIETLDEKGIREKLPWLLRLVDIGSDAEGDPARWDLGSHGRAQYVSMLYAWGENKDFA
jgi:hypothetical protein